MSTVLDPAATLIIPISSLPSAISIMTASVLAHEPWIRLAFFAGVFLLVAGLERAAPRRRLIVARGTRWVSNLVLAALNTLIVRLAFPLAAVGIAVFAQTRAWGLFNYWEVPYWFAVAASVIALDFAIYLQHVMFHAVPLFWRLHRMHHADLDFDVTTGVRFHPIEILLSLLIKFAVIVALGAPALAVLVFEILLNATSMFNHANARIPAGMDSWLRRLVVTPDMHRVHHSIAVHETNSNFGFNFPWWDRLFGTYKDQPDAGHEAMTIGIDGFRDARRTQRLLGMLVLPFRGPAGAYPINSRFRNARSSRRSR